MAQTVIRGAQILNNTVQRQDLDTSTVGQAVVTKIVQGSGITLSSTGADSGTGDVTVSGVSAVSTDAGNQSKLGSDSLIYTPGGVNGFISKTAAYTLTQADRNKYLICSGGSWTLTLPAASVGLCYNVRNDMGISGTTGTITLQPAAGTIDGLASIALLPQQECLIISDGTNWRTFGLKREVILGTNDITTATASAVILLPVGYRYFELDLNQIAVDTDQATVLAQLSADGGSTWLTGSTAYYDGLSYDNAATSMGYTIGGASYFRLSSAQTTLANFNSGISKVRLFPGSASSPASWSMMSGGFTAVDNRERCFHSEGFYNSGTGIKNALKYFPVSGNITRAFLTVKGVV